MAAIAIGLHFQDDRALAAAAMRDRLGAGCLHRLHIHAVDLDAGNVEGDAALGEIGHRAGARHAGAHGVLVVLDDVDDRQLPQLGHVEALIDLALVGGAVAEIGQADAVIAAIFVGEGQPRAERHLGADDAVAAIEFLLLAEHVHRAALALGIAGGAAGQLGHHAFGVHARRQHMAMVAIGGDQLVVGPDIGLHAHHHGFLADIEVAETADQPHAVKLTSPLFEAADQEHVAIELFEGFGIAASSVSGRFFLFFGAFRGVAHASGRSVWRGSTDKGLRFLARPARLGKRL